MNRAGTRYAVIGDPIAHSLSPQMQNAALRTLKLDAEYIAVRVLPSEIESFVERARHELAGFNITVPHKASIIPFLDEITPAAKLAGSVNTVTIREGRLWGDSTDGYGIEAAIREAFGLSLSGRNCAFLGCGGAVQAVACHFAAQGVAQMSFINRTVEKAEELASRVSAAFSGMHPVCLSPNETHGVKKLLAEADIVIQGTSLGLKPDDPAPVPPEFLSGNACFYETIYGETPLLRAARQRGIRCADGRGMLLHQGARSLNIWTGLVPPVEVMRKALEEALAARGVKQ